MSDGLIGYYVGTEANPSRSLVNLTEEIGYNNTLYFPRKWDGVKYLGYWLATPAAQYNGTVMRVGSDGYLIRDFNSNSQQGVRPAVYIPSTLKIYISNSVWMIAE